MNEIKVEFTLSSKDPAEVQNLINVLQGFLGKPKKTTTKAKKTPPPADADDNSDDDSGSEIKIDAVRLALAEKVGDNREAIKAKLTEYEAGSVTKLDKEHYAEFIEFLNDLD